MRTIELTYVEPRIHEEVTAHAAGNSSYFLIGDVEVASWQSR
jgi:hypothetical protein